MADCANIQADLDAAYAARRTALQHKSYRMDSGQGSQQVERQSLADIQNMIRNLESDLEGQCSDGSGMVYSELRR